jgi:hypothetical protein
MHTYLDKAAGISECGHYRYWLLRRLTTGDRAVLFVGLNPSSADGAKDDQTIRRCVRFARDWGFDCLLMANVYAYRATSPKILRTVHDPVGPLNQQVLTRLTERAELIVAAWGGQHRLDGYARTLANTILSLPTTRCLGKNGDNTPKHPLRVAANRQLVAVADQPRPCQIDCQLGRRAG